MAAEELADTTAGPPRLRLRAEIGHLFPPARVTWLALIALGLYGVWFFGGLGLDSLIALPIIAAVVDLSFQLVRFPGVRFPDAAVATGAFLALLFPPSAPLVFSGTVALAAIGIKHVLRLRGRPFMNPAASGVLLGVFLFGLAPAWWIGVDIRSEIAMILIGALVIARSRASWRLAPTFFLVFAPFSIAIKVLFAAALAPKILLLSILDPATLFFGLYMVSEPRTAPRDPRLQPLYAALIAFGAVFLPLLTPSVGVLVALVAVGFGGGLLRMVNALRLARIQDEPSRPNRRGRGAKARSGVVTSAGRREPSVWTIGRRVSAGFLLLLMISSVSLVAHASTSTPSVNLAVPGHSGSGGGAGGGGGSGSGLTAMCTSDTGSVPASTLQALHRALGPSVILSYDQSTGATVFYDPVNQVTVTETDLYEDYGFAEFNGDDFAVSGCSP